MIYFCADDYGISKESNLRIVKCLNESVLNKISVIPNGEIENYKEKIVGKDVKLSLHLNLVEGSPLSPLSEVDKLVSKKGYFKYSFVGLFFSSMFGNRKVLQEQLYKEIKNQLLFWKKEIGDVPLMIDSHQHVHMIPLIFKTLLKVIDDEKIKVDYLRMPDEPIMPYMLTFSFNIKGFIKQMMLKFCALFDKNKLKKAKINTGYFMGVMFSGKMTENNIKKVLPRYINLSKKYNKDIEITLHPGYLLKGERLIEGCREGFEKFYLSENRLNEYNALMNFKF